MFSSKLLLFSCIFMSLFVITNNNTIIQVNAFNSYDPRVEVADLKQNGSLTTPWIYNLTNDYSYIEKIIWSIDFSTNLLDFSKFDDSTALTNGINVFYNGQSLVGNETIKTNDAFSHFGYSIDILTDDANPKDHVIITQWLLTSFIPGGLEINSAKSIQIYIQDDLTALSSLTNFSATFKGYKIVTNTHFQIKEFNAQEFYRGQTNTLILQDLILGQNYNLFMNLSDGASKWINITAYTPTIILQYTFDVSSNINTLTIYLYQSNTYLEQITLFIAPDSIEPLASLITPIALWGGLLIVGVIIISAITNKKIKWK